MTWSLPDTYHLAGHGRGTATFKFYEGRDILPSAADGLLLLPGTSQVFAFMGPAGLPPAPLAS
jgi:hypothetical protein